MIATTSFSSILSSRGSELQWTAFDEFANSFRNAPTATCDKKDLALWSPFRFRDSVRKTANALSSTLIVFDVDQPVTDFGQFACKVNRAIPARGIVHSTHSSSAGAYRSRIVLLLSRPVEAAPYRSLAKLGTSVLKRGGIDVDSCGEKVAQPYFVPARNELGVYEFQELNGKPLDVDVALRIQNESDLRRRNEERSQRPRSTGRPSGHGYTKAAIRSAMTAVESAPHGHRHKVLYKETFSLARLQVPDAEIRNAMNEAGMRAFGQKGRAEVDRTVADAMKARRGQ